MSSYWSLHIKVCQATDHIRSIYVKLQITSDQGMSSNRSLQIKVYVKQQITSDQGMSSYRSLQIKVCQATDHFRSRYMSRNRSLQIKVQYVKLQITSDQSMSNFLIDCSSKSYSTGPKIDQFILRFSILSHAMWRNAGRWPHAMRHSDGPWSRAMWHSARPWSSASCIVLDHTYLSSNKFWTKKSRAMRRIAQNST
jgi:hypothetical protein